MTPTTRRRLQLLFAVVVLAVAAVFLWVADSAMAVQYQFLNGCWPQTVEFNGTSVLTESFWLDRVRSFDLGPVSFFLYSRVNHRILFYLIVLYAVVGWSGSICLRILQPGDARSPAHWEEVFASLVLSLIAGVVLFLVLVSARLIVDPSGTACVSVGYGYLVSLAGVGAGLFVVKFFSWFEGRAKGIWDALGSK